MATGETDTRVKTFITVSYARDGGQPEPEEHLLRQEVHRVKDEDTTDFVTVRDDTIDVGENDDWVGKLNDEITRLETQKDDFVDAVDDQIELLQEQIDEIDAL